MTNSTRGTVQTRAGKCENHGAVDATRKLPRLLFPFIITGAMRLIAMTRPFRCPHCGATTTKA